MSTHQYRLCSRHYSLTNAGHRIMLCDKAIELCCGTTTFVTSHDAACLMPESCCATRQLNCVVAQQLSSPARLRRRHAACQQRHRYHQVSPHEPNHVAAQQLSMMAESCCGTTTFRSLCNQRTDLVRTSARRRSLRRGRWQQACISWCARIMLWDKAIR